MTAAPIGQDGEARWVCASPSVSPTRLRLPRDRPALNHTEEAESPEGPRREQLESARETYNARWGRGWDRRSVEIKAPELWWL